MDCQAAKQEGALVADNSRSETHFDVTGRVLATPQDGQLPAGSYDLSLPNGADAGGALPAGIYSVLIYIDGKVVAQREITVVP
ncbi:MAG: hypothetical protein JXB46_07655 [Candidatus Eisenbacteria bacterium]|nr:hypothetical protein [Candidatus Eisenbacteria bacterium]